MKTIRFTILINAFVLLFTFGSSLQAQNAQDNYDILKGYLTDYIVLASQAEGTCQQIETFANNGNTNQLNLRIGSLIRSASEIGLIKMETARISVPNTGIMSGLRDLLEGIEGDLNMVNAFQRANTQGIAVLASALRESFSNHKGNAQEIRIAICCRAE